MVDNAIIPTFFLAVYGSFLAVVPDSVIIVFHDAIEAAKDRTINRL